jgi:hypothetical protein
VGSVERSKIARREMSTFVSFDYRHFESVLKTATLHQSITLFTSIVKAAMDFCSTPSRILDRVSQMTLKEPSTPITPYQTPIVKKRKPSTVTPPRGHIGMNVPNAPFSPINGNRKKRSLPGPMPMLPGSPEMKASSPSRNPFNQHKPIFSPVMRVSHVNFDFMATLQEQQDRDERPAKTRGSVSTALPFYHFFPDLENNNCDPQEPRRKILKMRRNEEKSTLFPVLNL